MAIVSKVGEDFAYKSYGKAGKVRGTVAIKPNILFLGFEILRWNGTGRVSNAGSGISQLLTFTDEIKTGRSGSLNRRNCQAIRESAGRDGREALTDGRFLLE